MNLKRACYAVCMSCIALGSMLSLVLIWTGMNSAIAWKGLGTIALFFFASLFTLAVHSAFQSSQPRGEAKADRGRRAGAPVARTAPGEDADWR